jgi:hypothetical protein
MHEQFNGCVATIGSMTQALRAQRVLANAALRAEIVKADSALTRRGCAMHFPILATRTETYARFLKTQESVYAAFTARVTYDLS